MGNVYDLSGEYGVGYLRISNEPFFFDKEDYEKIKGYTWRRKGKYAHGYKGGKVAYMHRVVATVRGNMIDHINRNGLDNRKTNLRIASPKENARNRSLASNNTSGCAGVVYESNRQRWKAQIWVDGKTINLGRYKNISDAIEVRRKAEKRYFGEFAPNPYAE